MKWEMQLTIALEIRSKFRSWTVWNHQKMGLTMVRWFMDTSSMINSMGPNLPINSMSIAPICRPDFCRPRFQSLSFFSGKFQKKNKNRLSKSRCFWESNWSNSSIPLLVTSYHIPLLVTSFLLKCQWFASYIGYMPVTWWLSSLSCL